MTTKLIGIKEFRQNISDFTQKAQKGNERYIIMNRNKPLFELKPFKEDQDLEDIFADIIVAKEDVKKGRVYSQEDILAEFA
ncbi:MAG: type II toxin-antitoxin system Phd/YefM family antitoxin [Candidatus Pacebacteria bacterium]|nr:type II toxin-antitoxin system Phd/YefM family antitoxin [Candidatus Paceibacterota bacterium]